MTTVQLRIRVGDDTYTYLDAEMGDGAIEAARSYRDGLIERDDVSLALFADTLGPFASPVEMDGGRYRAEVRDTAADVVILDGTIHRSGVRADDPATDGMRAWSVRVVQTAQADLDRGLDIMLWDEQIVEHVEGIEHGVVTVSSTVYREGDADSVGLPMWSVAALLEAALVAAGVAAPSIPELAPLRYAYTDPVTGEELFDGEDRTYLCYAGPLADDAPGAGRATIPEMTAREYVERVGRLFGLVIEASYAAWPSEDLAVSVTRPSALEADVATKTGADVQALDTLALAGYEIETDPARDPRAALVFANERPQPVDSLIVNPPAAAIYASPEVVYDARQETAVEPWRHVRVSDAVTADGGGGLGYAILYGRPWLDGEADEPFLLYLQGAARSHALVYVEVDDPLPTGQARRTNPLWATELFRYQAERAFDALRARLEVDADDLDEAPRPGRAQYELEGLIWTTEEAVQDADSHAVALTLVRAAAGSVLEAVEVQAGPPALAAVIEEITQGEVDGSTTLLRYDAVAYTSVPPELGEPDRIEVEYDVVTVPALPDEPEPTWPGTAGVVVADLDHPTDACFFRARSHYDSLGIISDWVEAQATLRT